jgi:hypothetical protein
MWMKIVGPSICGWGFPAEIPAAIVRYLQAERRRHVGGERDPRCLHQLLAGGADVDSVLRDKGLKSFFDRRNLDAGLPWVRALEKAIGSAKSAIVLIGPGGFGNTQQYERELAIIRQTLEPEFRVIPVILPKTGSELPFDFLQNLTWVDFSQVEKVSYAPGELERLLRAVRDGPTAGDDGKPYARIEGSTLSGRRTQRSSSAAAARANRRVPSRVRNLPDGQVGVGDPPINRLVLLPEAALELQADLAGRDIRHRPNRRLHRRAHIHLDLRKWNGA